MGGEWGVGRDRGRQKAGTGCFFGVGLTTDVGVWRSWVLGSRWHLREVCEVVERNSLMFFFLVR